MESNSNTKRLAIFDFTPERQPLPHLPYGTDRSAFDFCKSIERSGAFDDITYFEDSSLGANDTVRRPVDEFYRQENFYSGLYLPLGLLRNNPYGMRRAADRTPIISEFGTSHHPNIWRNMFENATTGCIRNSDAFIFKSTRTQRLWREIWNRWKESFPSMYAFPENIVIGNGVSCTVNQKDSKARAALRSELGFSEADVIYLAFSRLAPVSKLDFKSLILIWKEVVRDNPNARLLISGAVITSPDYRLFPQELRNLARSIGVSDSIVVLENPFEQWTNAKSALMSCADVFLHTTRGMEETCPNVVLEAMAYELPVIASNWAAISDLVIDDCNGWLVETYSSLMDDVDRYSLFGRAHHRICKEMESAVAIDGRQLVAAIRASQDSKVRLKFGKQSRERAVKNFDPAHIARRRVEYIASLASHKDKLYPHRCAPMFDLQLIVDGLAGLSLNDKIKVQLISEPMEKSWQRFLSTEDIDSKKILLWMSSGRILTISEILKEFDMRSHCLSSGLSESAIKRLIVRAVNAGFVECIL